MDIVTPILTGLGLAGPAGFNAYLPLLIVALAARFTDLVKLSAPYDILTSWWVIGALLVLLTIEMFADKIPGVDSVNDIIQTFIRPTAGGFLFLASTGAVTDINPVAAALAGVLTAGTVHGIKATARPVVSVSTAGLGNIFVSLMEDVIAGATSVLTLFLPIAGVLLLVPVLIIMVILILWLRRRRRRLA